MLDQKELVHSAYRLRPLPTSVQRLAAVAVQPVPDIAAIVEAVSFDPILTGRLLQVANSAVNNRQHQAASVQEAVMRMGSGMILGLAMGASTRPMVAAVIPGYDLKGDDFWEHAVTAALVADVSRSFAKTPWSPAGFTAALLHDIGKLVLGKFISAECRECLRDAVAVGGLEPYQAEFEVLSVHHAEVGALIAQHWKLPGNIVQGILHHHDPDEDSDILAHVTYLANVAAKGIQDGQGVDRAQERLLPVLRRLGLHPDSMGKIAAKVTARFAELREHYL